MKYVLICLNAFLRVLLINKKINDKNENIYTITAVNVLSRKDKGKIMIYEITIPAIILRPVSIFLFVKESNMKPKE